MPAERVPTLSGDNDWIVAEQLARRRRRLIALALLLESHGGLDSQAAPAIEFLQTAASDAQARILAHPAFVRWTWRLAEAGTEQAVQRRAWLLALPAMLAGDPGLRAAFEVAADDWVSFPTGGVRVHVPAPGNIAVEVGGGTVTLRVGEQTIAELDTHLRGATVTEEPALAGDLRIDVATDELRDTFAENIARNADLIDGDAAALRPIALDRISAARADYAAALTAIGDASHEDRDDLLAYSRSLVPFEGDGLDSFTRNDCLGALFLRWAPGDLWWNAEHLVHENGHLRLYALQEVCRLWLNPPDALYPSPWRRDPRPIEGIFQGTYVFYLTVRLLLRFVERFPESEPRLRPYLRNQIGSLDEGVAVLRRHAELTAVGGAFLADLAAAIEDVRRAA